MKSALCFALLPAIVAGGICFAQTNKESKPAVRQQMVPPPMRSPSAPAVPAHPSPYNIPGAQYPRIEADSRVTFRFKAPDAKSVQVAITNENNNNGLDMTKGEDGVWTYTSEPQHPGYHDYWMIVDGTIVLDPNSYSFLGWGRMCNGFEVPEPGVDFYDLKDVPHGDVLTKDYFAKTANSWRHIYIYTPPGYENSGTTRYPVLYLQHGGGEDNSAWIAEGRINWILDNMLAEGKIKPMIAVMESSSVPGPASAGRGPGMGAPGGGAYGQLVINDLIPWIDSHFRTLADKDHRGMVGPSMGGMVTASIAMANLDKFSYIGLFSGGAASGFGPNRSPSTTPVAAPAPPPPPPLDLKTVYGGAMANPAEFNQKVKVFFLSSGTYLPLENPEGLKKHYQELVDNGITNAYLYISPDTTHEWHSWKRSFYAFAPLLF
jgi:S-formylglutathione hydrolase FrmB